MDEWVNLFSDSKFLVTLLTAITGVLTGLRAIIESRRAAHRDALETLRSHVAFQDSRIEKLQAELGATLAVLESARAENKRLSERLAVLELELERYRRENQQLQMRIEELEEDNTKKDSRIAELERELEKLRRELVMNRSGG